MDTFVTKPFADGEYTFALKLPQAIEVERACAVKGVDGSLVGKSVFVIYDQLSAGLAYAGDDLAYVGGGFGMVGDVRAVIRQGLIGGGEAIVNGQRVEIGPVRADQLLDAYTFPARPMIEAVQLAWHILHAAIHGIDVKKKDEPEPVNPKPKRSKKASS